MLARKLGELCLLLTVVVLTVVYYFTDLAPIGTNTDVKVYVVAIMIGLIVFILFQIFKLFTTNDSSSENVSGEDENSEGEASNQVISSFGEFVHMIKENLKNKIFMIAGLTIAYFFMITYAGFFVSTFLFIILALVMLDIRSKWMLITIPLGFCISVYIIFGFLLNVSFQTGWLF